MSEVFSVYLVKHSYEQQADDDKCSAVPLIFYCFLQEQSNAKLSVTVVKDHVTRLRLIFKQELCKLN